MKTVFVKANLYNLQQSEPKICFSKASKGHFRRGDLFLDELAIVCKIFYRELYVLVS